METLFLSYEQVAKVLNISQKTVEKLVLSGDIPSIKFGRLVRIPKAYIDNLATEATEAVG